MNGHTPGRWLAGLLLLILTATATAAAGPKKKVFVLGVDGLDPKILQRLMDEGRLPNFKRMIASGDFKPLQTSMPPLSPVAWSNFITGMDPGGHGIFDFIHRDPATLLPFEAMARAEPASGKVLGFLPSSVAIGSYVFPLKGGTVENLRKGQPFWEVLEQHGVPTTVYRMPVNFPPSAAGGREYSGMGTPDIRGTTGTFAFYTDRPFPGARGVAGGKIYPVRVIDNKVEAKLVGPPNPFRRVPRSVRGRTRGGKVSWKSPDAEVNFTVYLDPEEPVARFVVGNEEFILQEGEWSEWVRVDFSLRWPLDSASSIGRFYLKQVRPDFELYVTPLQINPEDPALPVSSPNSWSHELCEELGYFYTQMLPEDTKALTHGVLTPREFWDQSQFVYKERRRAMDYLLDRFEEGFLFFYYSSIDQGTHMLWHFADDEHPAFAPDELLKNGIRSLYEEMDDAIGRILEVTDDDTTLIVMSDHGFGPFYRQVNLNSWLVEKGYTTLLDPSRQGQSKYFGNVDWSRTRAYALGLNGLYLNLEGRERSGVVPPEEYQVLLDRLEQDLLEMRDPKTGESAVTLVVQPHRDFKGPHMDIGPDIIVGYNWGYRTSWKSPLGEFPKEIFVDNDEPWSGDHSGDYRLVPGVLISNRKITLDSPTLYDLTVAILDEYGIPKTEPMIGRDCLGPQPSGSSAGE